MAFTGEFLRKRATGMPRLTPPFVEGFTRLIRNAGETASWFTYRKQKDIAETLRQMVAGASIEWETAPLPEILPGDSLTFVFAGGLGWISQPVTEGFALSINGKEALRFDVTTKHNLWRDDSGQVALSFVARRMTSEDAAGLFYLGVPAALVSPGQPVRFTVTSLGSGSQRWFALHPYTDTLSAQH
jgi:hypothetical protein